MSEPEFDLVGAVRRDLERARKAPLFPHFPHAEGSVGKGNALKEREFPTFPAFPTPDDHFSIGGSDVDGAQAGAGAGAREVVAGARVEPCVGVGNVGNVGKAAEFCGLRSSHMPDPMWEMWEKPNPTSWRRAFEARVAARRFLHGAEAERLAYGEVIEAWCRQHPEAARPGACAHCGDALDGREHLLLVDGGAVHVDDDFACLIAFGRARRGRAELELAALGVPAPEGWDP